MLSTHQLGIPELRSGLRKNFTGTPVKTSPVVVWKPHYHSEISLLFIYLLRNSDCKKFQTNLELFLPVSILNTSLLQLQHQQSGTIYSVLMVVVYGLLTSFVDSHLPYNNSISCSALTLPI